MISSNKGGNNNSGDTQELDNSGGAGGNGSNHYLQSPSRTPDYNRMKFYSALKTGYQQLNPEVKAGFLKAPKNLASEYKYLVLSPFFKETAEGEEKTQSSI